jgi:chemotaxis response regulator CheB
MCTPLGRTVIPFVELEFGRVADARIKVLVADDAQLLRRLICRLLKEQPEINIVGEAADFAQTVEIANDLRPQIIVIDLHLCSQGGITPLDVKTQLNHGSRLVVISLSNDEEAKALAESFGAVTLLDKMRLFDELIPTILQFA